ncbi:MAG: head-tail connector protein [Flavobacteriaceae bacterium]
MAYKVTIHPTIEPITLTEAKNHLKMDEITVDDDLITALIKAAREDVEASLNRKLVDTRIVEYYSGWGKDVKYGECLRLSLSPILEVMQIDYTDKDGNNQSLATDQYQNSLVVEPHYIYSGVGKTFPTLQAGAANPVRVTYRAGYGTAASDVPSVIKQAILLQIGYLYDNRDDKARTFGTASERLLKKLRYKFY